MVVTRRVVTRRHTERGALPRSCRGAGAQARRDQDTGWTYCTGRTRTALGTISHVRAGTRRHPNARPRPLRRARRIAPKCIVTKGNNAFSRTSCSATWTACGIPVEITFDACRSGHEGCCNGGGGLPAAGRRRGAPGARSDRSRTRLHAPKPPKEATPHSADVPRCRTRRLRGASRPIRPACTGPAAHG